MRILLINPETPSYILPDKEFVLSLALLSLASILKEKNHVVEILDLNIYRPWKLKNANEHIETVIMNRVLHFNPSLIGISCLFSGQFEFVMNYAKICKQLVPTPIAIGGMHPTIYPREILTNCSSIDYVIIGEGEHQILEIANGIQNGVEDFSKIDGVAWRNSNDEIFVNEKTTFIQNLDELPLPAYDLINFSDYRHDTSNWHNPKKHQFSLSVPIISSRSCPMHCNFCSMFLVMGPRIRMRSPEHVVDEIEILYSKYGQKHFSFMDDNISLNKRHILGICDEIVRRGLDIQFETPNGLMTSSLNREVMDAMTSAGWIRGAIAIESGSDYIRNKIMGKHLAKEKIFEIIQLSKKYPQLFLKAFFIIGMPEDTSETLQETYNMIEEIYNDIYVPFVTNLVPFPGTAVFEQAKKENLFIDEFDFDNLWKMNGFHYHNNNRFYLKPYQMELSELSVWREKFDYLLENQPLKIRKSYD